MNIAACFVEPGMREAEPGADREAVRASRPARGGGAENSRAAFEAAIEAGHGIELDVQASADGEAMVFHDYELEPADRGAGRLCATLGAAELERIRLQASRTRRSRPWPRSWR